MGFVKTLVKGAVVAKLAQIAQRELSKPENQRKIKEAFQKVQQRGGAHYSRSVRLEGVGGGEAVRGSPSVRHSPCGVLGHQAGQGVPGCAVVLGE